jgi:hypothetical protein
MAAILCLVVLVRVPIAVKDDTDICRGQVDPKSTRSRGEQENKLLVMGTTVEVVDHLLSLLDRHRAINVAIVVALVL